MPARPVPPDPTLERAREWARERHVKLPPDANIEDVLTALQEHNLCEAARLVSHRYRMLLETMELAMTNFKGDPH